MSLLKYSSECYEIIKYKHYITKDNPINEKKLHDLCRKTGLHLLVAKAGGGKTYSIIEMARKLSVLDNKVYVIACPNRIQNLQNQKSYKIFALVGGTEVDYTTTIVSTVYDKSEEIIEKLKELNKEVVLIIDEAHQLITADGYRNNAIRSLQNLQDYAETVIHMTATPRKLFRHFDYDTKTKFQSTTSDINIKKLNIQIASKTMNEAILLKVKDAITKKKTAMVLINDKLKIDYYAQYYKKLGYKVGVLTGKKEHKDSDLFNYVVEKESIPSEYDVILTTTVVEVGTNIKSYNLIPVYAVCNSNHFDIDSVIQFFARFRRDDEKNLCIDEAFLLIPKQNKKSTIKSINALEEEIRPGVEADLDYISRIAFDLFDRYNLKERSELLNAYLSVQQKDGGTLGSGLIKIDEDGIPYLDEKGLTNKLYREFDKSLLSYTNALESILENEINYQEIHFSVIDIESDEKKELYKVKEEIEIDYKEEAKKIIQKLFNLAPVELDLLISNKLTVNGFSDEFKKDVEFLREEKTQLKLLRKAYKLKLDLPEVVKIIVSSETDSTIEDILRSIAYVKFNNNFDIGYYENKNVRDEYGVFRRNLDPLIGTNKRISTEIYISILNDLNKINKFKIHYKRCKKLYELLEKKKKSSLSTQDKKDLSKLKNDFETFKSILDSEINRIYILNAQFRIKKLKQNT